MQYDRSLLGCAKDRSCDNLSLSLSISREDILCLWGDEEREQLKI